MYIKAIDLTKLIHSKFKSFEFCSVDNDYKIDYICEHDIFLLVPYMRDTKLLIRLFGKNIYYNKSNEDKILTKEEILSIVLKTRNNKLSKIKIH